MMGCSWIGGLMTMPCPGLVRRGSASSRTVSGRLGRVCRIDSPQAREKMAGGADWWFLRENWGDGECEKPSQQGILAGASGNFWTVIEKM